MKTNNIFRVSGLISILLLASSCGEEISITTSLPSISTNTDSTTTSYVEDEVLNEIKLNRETNYNKIEHIYQGEEINKIVKPVVISSEYGSLSFKDATTYYGNINEVTITSKAGYRMAALLVNNIYVTNSPTYRFYAHKDDVFEALFVEEDKYMVICLDEASTYLSSYIVNKYEKVNVDDIYKNYSNYSMTIENIDQTESVINDIVLTPTYIKKGKAALNISSMITYDNKSYNYGDEISLSTPDLYDNKVFAYFKINDEIVSYSKDYKTLINEDMNIEAIYLDNTVDSYPNISLSNLGYILNNKLTFTANYAKYSTASIIDFGIIYKEKIDDSYISSSLFHSFYTYSEDINQIKISTANKKGYYQSYIVYRFIVNNIYKFRCFFSDLYKY